MTPSLVTELCPSRRAGIVYEVLFAILIVGVGALLIGGVIYAGHSQRARLPANPHTLAIGSRVFVGERNGYEGVVLSVTDGGPEKPATARVRVTASGGLYPEATFLVTELWVQK